MCCVVKGLKRHCDISGPSIWTQVSSSWMCFSRQTFLLHVATPSGVEWLSPCRTSADHTVDQEAAKLLLLCLNNLFSPVKEVWSGLTTNQGRSHNRANWECVHNYFVALARCCLPLCHSKTLHYKHVCAANYFWRSDRSNPSLRVLQIYFTVILAQLHTGAELQNHVNGVGGIGSVVEFSWNVGQHLCSETLCVVFKLVCLKFLSMSTLSISLLVVFRCWFRVRVTWSEITGSEEITLKS